MFLLLSLSSLPVDVWVLAIVPMWYQTLCSTKIISSSSHLMFLSPVMMWQTIAIIVLAICVMREKTDEGEGAVGNMCRFLNESHVFDTDAIPLFCGRVSCGHYAELSPRIEQI